MTRRRQVYEGKAKVLYRGSRAGHAGTVFQGRRHGVQCNKKKGTITGKGVMNNRISANTC
jgi:phosphoribosylaminoimidazole-succinocarboxamide synthase